MVAALITPLGIALLGYLAGSLPFALWITRMYKGVDLRAVGSGHTTATNTIRHAGWGPGVIVLSLDMAKGFLPTYLAARYGGIAWAAPVAAALAVMGHCWPLWAGFRGGMGLATSAGAILAISPLGFVISLGVLVALVLGLHHAARASLVAGLVTPVVLWLFGFRGVLISVTAAVGLVIAVRFLSDWNRKYRELWLDRELRGGEGQGDPQ